MENSTAKESKLNFIHTKKSPRVMLMQMYDLSHVHCFPMCVVLSSQKYSSFPNSYHNCVQTSVWEVSGSLVGKEQVITK